MPFFNPTTDKYFPTPTEEDSLWDVIIIGTGFGGGTTAMKMSEAGLRVLLIERGSWVKRDLTSWDEAKILVKKIYEWKKPIEMKSKSKNDILSENSVVGGKSVFFGGVSTRLRESDFNMAELFSDVSSDGAKYVNWPISYTDIEPYYSEAELLYEIHGNGREDTTEPPRSINYEYPPSPYTPLSNKLYNAGKNLGLNPFNLPMAINYFNPNGRLECIKTNTCDLFPCMIMAKNEVTQMVLPSAFEHGAKILTDTEVVELEHNDSKVSVVAVKSSNGDNIKKLKTKNVVLSCGAVGSAFLLMKSGITSTGKGSKYLGKNLMIHCSGLSAGLMKKRIERNSYHPKQIGFNDYYFGNGSWTGHLGTIQGHHNAPPELIKSKAPWIVKGIAGKLSSRFLNLLVIAEDLPRIENRVEMSSRKYRDGTPKIKILHNYTSRDKLARKILIKKASKILRSAGCYFTKQVTWKTLSHALGTCRFGSDPDESVLDIDCKLHGWDNLYVIDGSFMPTSGGVNPSLTITANALRVCDRIVPQLKL